MRVLAWILAAILAASPMAAFARAQISTTNLPRDGKFAFIAKGEDNDGPVVGYLRMPDTGPGADGQVKVWLVQFYAAPRTEDGVTGAYATMSIAIDCTRHLARPTLGLLYGPDDRQADSFEMEDSDWASPADGTPLASMVAVICDSAEPAGPPLEGLAAARADARERLGGD